MTVPFDAFLAIGVTLLGIVSAIAHRGRCFLQHVGSRWDWGVGYDDPTVVDSLNHETNQSSPRCAPIPEMLAVVHRVIRRVRGS